MAQRLHLGLLPPVRRERRPRRPPAQPPPRPKPPPFRIRTILAWADAHYRRHGRWPSRHSGGIAGSPDETWENVDNALARGNRGLPGGSTLSQCLMRHGRRPRRILKRHPQRHRPLSVGQILAWADAYFREHGAWPGARSGSIAAAQDETWECVNDVLKHGGRGLPGGSSLALLLEQRRGRRHREHLPQYTARGIVAWADAHYRRHGRWPSRRSGAIPEAPGETWHKVEHALRKGSRGLPGGDTLARLLNRCRR